MSQARREEVALLPLVREAAEVETVRQTGRETRARAPRTNHQDLWEHVNGLREDVGELKGQVKVIMAIAGATFLGVFGLMLAAVFG